MIVSIYPLNDVKTMEVVTGKKYTSGVQPVGIRMKTNKGDIFTLWSVADPREQLGKALALLDEHFGEKTIRVRYKEPLPPLS